MAMTVRMTGGLMLAYSALYTAHFIFDTLYDVRFIRNVLNVISAAGILIALAVNFVHMRAKFGQQSVTISRLCAYALVYAEHIPNHARDAFHHFVWRWAHPKAREPGSAHSHCDSCDN